MGPVPALIVAQKWLPAWLTPIWILAAGLTLGAIASAIVYGVFSILSFLPGLGSLPDAPKRGVITSLVAGGLISIGLCIVFIPRAGADSNMLYVPLICIGVLLGFGLIYGLWNRTRSEWGQILTEGVVPYLLSVAGILMVIGLVSTPFVADPMSFINSVKQVNLFSDGTVVRTVPVPAIGEDVDPNDAPFVPANIDYDLRSVSELTITSDKAVLLGDAADTTQLSKTPTRINPEETLTYRVTSGDELPISGDSTRLFIQNREINQANVTFSFKYMPQIPEAASIVRIALAFFITLTGLMAFRQAAPRVWALALSTAKNEMAQPLYLLLLAMGIFGVLLFGIYPFNTLGDDIRLLKDSGVTLIMVLGMLQAVWSAGTSVSDEIEGRTALTVLSKPISRRSFILGKYAGIMLAVLVLFVIIASVLLVVISYKPIYDARESTRAVTTWQQGHEEIMTTIPVLGLYFMETMVIGAIAVALATRLPLLANFITCFVIYIIGNLTSPLVASTEGNNELVGFIGKLIAVVVPNLNVFNVQSALDAGNPVPEIYVAGAFNYLVFFAIAIWMLAMLLFEDRDLA
jgi:ABC-type transport system involved in multi-copper enzyme maturation permease subunit